MTEKQELIEVWTSPLEDNAELLLHARSLLGEVIDENAATLSTVAKWMKRPSDRRKRRVMLWVLFILAFVGFLYPVLTAYRLLVALSLFNPSTDFSMKIAPQVQATTEEETFLLYGDLSRSKVSDQRRALWERDPHNVAYFAEYAAHYISENSSLPPDYFNIAAELDHDNAWYFVTAAATKSNGVIRKEKTHHQRSPVSPAQLAGLNDKALRKMRKRIVYEYTVVNPSAMEEVLALWRQSLQHKRYENHATSLHQMRYPIFLQHVSFVSHINNLIYCNLAPSISSHERDIIDVLVAALQNADMQSKEGKQLFQDITTYTERIVEKEPTTLIDVLRMRAICRTFYQQIDVIDTSALDSAMVATWRQRKIAIQQLCDDLSERSDAQSDFLSNHASLLTKLVLPWMQRLTLAPLHLSNDDLKPVRYSEHSLFLQLIAVVSCVFLLAMVPYHLWGRNGKLTHRLSDAIWLSMPWLPVVRLFVLSSVVPLLYFLVLITWTPLTGKEYGAGMGFLFPFAPAISVVLIIFMLPRLLSHRFIATWQKLQPQSKSWYLRLGWTALVLLLLPLHLLPWITQVTESEDYINAFMGICWLPAILWLLWTLFAGFFTRGFYPAVMHSLRRRAVGACTLSSIILLSLTCWALKQCESYWLKKDTVMAISPDKPTFRYEAEIIKRAHADLRGAMQLVEE